MNCPLCQKKHRKFPRICFSSAQNDYSHVVIAKATGSKEIFEYVEEMYLKMKKYVEEQFPSSKELKQLSKENKIVR